MLKTKNQHTFFALSAIIIPLTTFYKIKKNKIHKYIYFGEVFKITFIINVDISDHSSLVFTFFNITSLTFLRDRGRADTGYRKQNIEMN